MDSRFVPPRHLLGIALAMLMLATAGAGCDGSDDDRDPEAEARGAVADLLAGIREQDPAAACDALTPAARKRAGGPAGECSDVIGHLFEGPGAPSPVADASEQIRAGEIENGDVTVTVADGNGMVTLTFGSASKGVPVEDVDGEWLVSSATALLPLNR